VATDDVDRYLADLEDPKRRAASGLQLDHKRGRRAP